MKIQKILILTLFAIALNNLMTNVNIREDLSLDYKDFQYFTSKSGKNEDLNIQNNDTNENKFRKCNHALINELVFELLF